MYILTFVMVEREEERGKKDACNIMVEGRGS
jgi:hypothetical protein